MKKKESKNITFVRIRGRIVPIKKKNPSPSELYKSAGLTAAGVGVSIGAGRLAAQRFKKAFKVKQQAFSFIDEMGGNIPRNLQRDRFLGIKKGAKRSARLGALLGGSLLSRGLTKTAQQFGADDSIKNELISDAASHTAANLVFDQTRRGLGLPGKSKLKTVGKALAKKFFSKQLRFKF